MVGKPKGSNGAYKYAKIKTELSVQILEGQYRPHDKILSLNEITHKYKVSKITARRVLNDLMTEGLVYTSHGKGAFVTDAAMRQNTQDTKQNSNQIGVVFEHGSGLFMGDIISGIDEEAFKSHSQINLCLSNNSYEREAENLLRLAEQGVNKILLFMVLYTNENAINPNISLYLRLQEQGIRLLLLNCHIPGFPIPSITYDDYNSFSNLVKHMKNNRCNRLVYVTRIDNASTTKERLQGFKDGLLENSLPYDNKSIVRVEIQSIESVLSDTYKAFSEYIKDVSNIDSIICSDEMVAAGVCHAYENANIPIKQRPMLGGMGCKRNLYLLRGNPYVLLENDTHRLGVEAMQIIKRNGLPNHDERNLSLFRHIIPVPLRMAKTQK